MAKKHSQEYLGAKAALLDILGDGKEHNYLDVEAEMARRGFELSERFTEADRALTDLQAITTGDTEDGRNDWFWHLPLCPKPAHILMRVWAVEFLRMVLGNGEQDAMYVKCWAEEFGIPHWSTLCAARRALGVKTRRALEPNPYCPDSEMKLVVDYWRLSEHPLIPKLASDYPLCKQMLIRVLMDGQEACWDDLYFLAEYCGLSTTNLVKAARFGLKVERIEKPDGKAFVRWPGADAYLAGRDLKAQQHAVEECWIKGMKARGLRYKIG